MTASCFEVFYSAFDCIMTSSATDSEWGLQEFAGKPAGSSINLGNVSGFKACAQQTSTKSHWAFKNLSSLCFLRPQCKVYCLQYEEPTDEVQSLRDKVELDRCHLASWLRDLAVLQGESSRAMNGSAADQLPSSLALSAEDLLRAQKQLHIPKQQVHASSCRPLPIPSCY